MVFVKTASRGSATCVTGPAGPPHHAATLADSTARHPWQTGFSDDQSTPEPQPRQEDHQPCQAIASGDGIHSRPGSGVLAA